MKCLCIYFLYLYDDILIDVFLLFIEGFFKHIYFLYKYRHV